MQPFASHTSTDWVLVTGQPGCGKTTAVKTLVDELRASGASVRGFYTDEVLSGGRRVGFDIVTVPDGRRGPLARSSSTSVFTAVVLPQPGWPVTSTQSVLAWLANGVCIDTCSPLALVQCSATE